jgi:hypothetical protein
MQLCERDSASRKIYILFGLIGKLGIFYPFSYPVFKTSLSYRIFEYTTFRNEF